MARKVSIFGVRGTGKTCYIYAMAEVMGKGVSFDGTTISLIANDLEQQQQLTRGIEELACGEWPMGSQKATTYDFRVRLQHEDQHRDIIPSLLVQDYRGGLLEGEYDEKAEFEELLGSFADACAIVFLVDGETLLQALDPLDAHPDHRIFSDGAQLLKARHQISFIENLFLEYKKRNKRIPPVMVAITKSDLFLNQAELENGKALIRRSLSSIFAKGSGIDAAITAVSLGENLSRDEQNHIVGTLGINTSKNPQIPVLYALYAYLDSVYDGSPANEQAFMDSVLYALRRMFEGHVDMYINGNPAIEIV